MIENRHVKEAKRVAQDCLERVRGCFQEDSEGGKSVNAGVVVEEETKERGRGWVLIVGTESMFTLVYSLFGKSRNCLVEMRVGPSAKAVIGVN